jgi:hypothetical protein
MADQNEQGQESAVSSVAAQPVREYHGEVWGYSSSESPDVWDGSCVSREAAIQEGRLDLGEDEAFWIIEGQWLEVGDFFDADDVIEAAETQVYDNAHEGAELDIREGGKDALNALLTAWAEKYAVLRSWTAVGDAQEIAPIQSVETECVEQAHGEDSCE